MSKPLSQYVSEGISAHLKQIIIKQLNSDDLDDSDAMYILNRLDKDGDARVKDYLKKYDVPDKFLKRIIQFDKMGEIRKIADGQVELPTFSSFKTGSNLINLFAGVLSEPLIREIYDIEGSSGTGNIGKGEMLLNLFIRSEQPGGKGKSGDVHIWDNNIQWSIEIKTTPNAHPGDRNVKTFALVIDSIADEFGISKDEADMFFRVRSATKVNQIVKEYMSRTGSSNKEVFEKIFNSILKQFDADPSDQNDFAQLKPDGFVDRSGKVDIQALVNLVGAVQTKHYIKEQSEEVNYMCIIDGKTTDYKLIDCEALQSIAEIIALGIKFSNSMDRKYAAGSQTSTMKIADI